MGGWQQCQQQRCGFLEDPAQGGGRGRTQSPSPSLGQRPLGTPTRTPTSHPGHPTGLLTPARTSVLAVLRSFPAAAAGQRRAWHCPRGEASPALPGQRLRHCTHLKPHRGLHPEVLGGRQGKEVTWGSAGPAHTCCSAGTAFWHCLCPPPPAMPCSHSPTRDALGAAGTTFPGGPSRAEHRAGYPHRLAGPEATAGSLCSAPALRRDLAAKAGQTLLRAGGSRGLPGPRARPAALTAAARQGWRSPSRPSLPSLWERADPLRLPPAALAVSVAALDREALGVSWQWGAGAGSRRGPGERGTGPMACPPWHGVQPRPPQDGLGGAGAGWGRNMPSS